MTRKPPPLPGLPPTDEAEQAQFSETLWFKIGALEQEEPDASKPPPVPLDARYATGERLSLADRQQFSLHSHVPPAPTKTRRATSFAEPYDDDDLERYAVRWTDRIGKRRGRALAALAVLAVAATAALATTGGGSEPETGKAALVTPESTAPAVAQTAEASPETTQESATVPGPPRAERRVKAKRSARATAKRASRAKRAKARRAKAKRAKAKRAKAKRAKAKRARRRRSKRKGG